MLATETLSVSCPTGAISEVTHFGVYAKGSEADQRSLCTSEGVSVSTGLDCASVSRKDHSFYTDKLQPCVGQESCLIHGLHDDLPLGGQSGDAGCSLSETDSLFVQYNCKVADEELAEKRWEALFASCVNIFSALTLLSVTKYRVGSISIEKREWDLQTVTASDYTLEIALTKEQVAVMRQAIYQESFAYGESDGMQIKMYLTRELEKALKDKYPDEDGRVADINFAYYNSWLLDSLRTRGDHIKYQQWGDLNQLNGEVTEKLRDPDTLADLTTPKCAFVSIETETAYNQLADWETEDGQKGKIELAGHRSSVKEAPEPTNVIWENRDFDKTVRWAKFILVCLAVIAVLFVTFLATVKAKSMTNDLIGKYDDSINCNEMAHMYPPAALSQLAADEWLDYYKNGGDDSGRQISPTLSCFCTSQYMEIGQDAAEKSYTSTDG